MADSPYVTFSFTVDGQDDDVFEVIEFTAQEELSRPYHVAVTLLSKSPVANPQELLVTRALLIVASPVQRIAFNGFIRSFKHISSYENEHLYQAEMTASVSLLKLSRASQVFLDQSIPQIIQTVLKQCAITVQTEKLTGKYEPREYVCQLGETHFDFLSRWMERLGIYYFYDDSTPENLIITDTKEVHKRSTDQKLVYAPASGLEGAARAHNVLTSFTQEHVWTSAKVFLKDYNYQESSVPLEATAKVTDHGAGQHYEYGSLFQKQADGQCLAQVRAQALAAEGELYHGAVGGPWMRAGFLFEVEGHPDERLNSEYLAVRMTHEGRTRRKLVDGLRLATSESSPEYRATFTAIPASKQYRARRLTPRPTPGGFLSATIDAEGAGQYAYLDKQGRYKVKLPFEQAGAPAGRASCWIRQMQPYGGASYGRHFPLLKGAEVMLTFVDGDVDRPVIAGVVTNQENQNLVTNANNAVNATSTPGGNQLVMSDAKGSKAIALGGEGSVLVIHTG